jgi:CheY-like chemotaxis protein
MYGAVDQQPNRLLARMNHEVRSKVNVILRATELLLESDLNPEQSFRLRMARSSADRLLSESTKIMDLAQAEWGTLRLQTGPFDLRETVPRTIGLLSIFAEPKGIVLRTHISDQVPSVLVGDSERINQILITLVRAGIDQLEYGEILVTVARESNQEERVAIKFSVVDSGPRIAPNIMNRIFDSCSDRGADNDGAPRDPSGIDLALSKRLAEGMGGGMWAEDGPESGTAFHFKVLLASPHEVESPDAGVQNAPDRRDRRPLKILVAEDAPDNLFMIQAFLKDQPWRIESAVNGNIALHKATTSCYDLILMDLDLPEMDGHTATRYIRSSVCQNKMPAVPIVALTSHDDSAARLKSIEAGCTAHVTKPITKAALIETIRHYAL